MKGERKREREERKRGRKFNNTSFKRIVKLYFIIFSFQASFIATIDQITNFIYASSYQWVKNFEVWF